MYKPQTFLRAIKWETVCFVASTEHFPFRRDMMEKHICQSTKPSSRCSFIKPVQPDEMMRASERSPHGRQNQAKIPTSAGTCTGGLQVVLRLRPLYPPTWQLSFLENNTNTECDSESWKCESFHVFLQNVFQNFMTESHDIKKSWNIVTFDILWRKIALLFLWNLWF